jgi:hypothetical protein
VIKASLDAEGEYVIKGRPKSIYSRRKNANQNALMKSMTSLLRIVYKANPHDEKFWLGKYILL